MTLPQAAAWLHANAQLAGEIVERVMVAVAKELEAIAKERRQ